MGSDQVQPNGDCLITLSGLEASILLAQFLIQNNVEQFQKQSQHQHVEQNNQHGLYPTNQFGPSIMQSNFNNEGQQNSQEGPQNNFHQNQQQQNRGNFRNNFNENRFGGGHHRGRGRRSPTGDN